MNFLYTALRIYPYWAIPLAFIFFEIGIVLKRRHIKKAWIPMVLAVAIGITCLVWIFYRGDLHSDRWIKALLQP